MTSAKLGAVVTTALTIMYVALLGNSAFQMIQTGITVAVFMGWLLLIFPVLAIVFIVAELRFGLRVEKLGKVLEDAGEWPRFDFEMRPSGRVVRASADAEFVKYRANTDADPANWKNWFALGLVYDAAGDRKRARASMRKAIELANDAKAL